MEFTFGNDRLSDRWGRGSSDGIRRVSRGAGVSGGVDDAIFPSSAPSGDGGDEELCVFLNAKCQCFEWSPPRGVRQTSRDCGPIRLRELVMEWEPEGHPSANIGPHWQLQIAGRHKDLGHCRIKVGAGIAIYQIIERMSSVDAGTMIWLRLHRSDRGVWVELYVHDGREWSAVPSDLSPADLTQEAETKVAQAIQAIGSHPAFGGWCARDPKRLPPPGVPMPAGGGR